MITYGNKGVQGKTGNRYVIWQYYNGFPVNEYFAYDRGKDHFILYPVRRINPSNIPLEKQSVSIFKIRREF